MLAPFASGTKIDAPQLSPADPVDHRNPDFSRASRPTRFEMS